MQYIIKGDIIYSKDVNKLETIKDGYIVCIDGISRGVYSNIPDEYKDFKIIDYTDKLIIPGLVDLHTHAPQYMFRGMWMDMELLDWLNNHTFPEESKYKDVEYAKKAYEIFVKDLKYSATTRACIFSTLHVDSTDILMDLLEKSDMHTYVGKVNMDRNSPEILSEITPENSYINTLKWLENSKKYKNTKPIITPRFIPSCSDELMKKLSDLVKREKINVQSHLSENQGEIEWIKELCPWSKNYSDAYDKMNLFGNYSKTIMAHCVWCNDEEIELMKKRDIFIAHCPTSNANLSSGIAPIKKYLMNNLKVGLGSDVAGGTDKSIIKVMVFAIQMSKLYWRLLDSKIPSLTLNDVFYMATKGGGEFFGKVGSFEKDYELDMLVLDESHIPTTLTDLTLQERLERFIYLSDDSNILHKFVKGKKIF